MPIIIYGFTSEAVIRIPSIAILLVTCCSLGGYAQNGANDPSFNPADVGLTAGVGPDSWVKCLIIQVDGKIVIGGLFTKVDGVKRNHIARLNTDGSLDQSFDPGTGANSTISHLFQVSGGKLVIAGSFTSYNGTSRKFIARLNGDGSLDTSFDPGTGPNTIISSIDVQADQKIIIGGSFSSYNGTSRSGLARLNVDGSLDITLDAGIPFLTSFAVGLQADGKIILSTGSSVIRLNSTGTLDGTFNFNGPSQPYHAVRPQTGGKTYITGNLVNKVVRLNSDGTVDNTFDSGTGFDSYVTSFHVRPDGKVLAGGYFTSLNGVPAKGIALQNTDGSVDLTFNAGLGLNNAPRAIQLQADGKIVLCGEFTKVDNIACNFVGRLSSSGSREASFGSLGSGANNYVGRIARQPDGKVIIIGRFSSYNGVTRSSIIRVDANGSPDASFDAGAADIAFYPSLGSWLVGGISSLAIQPDAKLLLGGSFNYFNNISRNGIARLNSDGTVDLTFNPTHDGFGVVTGAHLQSDNKIILTGYFSNVDGTPRERVARLNSNGSLDPTFDAGTGPSNVVLTVAFQPDGKIVVGGYFTTFDGQARGNVARLNTDGSLDATFNPNANAGVLSIVIRSDGKIVIGGQFTTVGGSPRNGIARLNSNGTLDLGFDPGSGAVGSVFTTEAMPDGNLLIGGDFTSYNGVALQGIALLNENGSLNTSFNGSFQSGGEAYDFEVQGGNRVLVSGSFSSYGGAARNNLARAFFDLGTNVAPVITGQESLSTTVNEPITVSLSELTVVDPDNNYPADFSLTIQSGANYTVSTSAVTPDLGFIGTLAVPVTVSDGIASSNVFQLQITVTELDGDGTIKIYNALSPNEDAKNEILHIENIEKLPETRENTVRVFNRWGDVVFEIENYDNTNRVFQGLNKDGSALPPGTYYYRIEFKSGVPSLAGFISLRK